MKKSYVKLACALALVFTICGAARADIRVKKTMSVGSGGQGGGGEESGGRGGGFTTVEMIKGQRKRSEQEFAPGFKRVNVLQCDLKRTIDINDPARKYFVTPIGGVDETRMNNDPSSSPDGGRVTRGGVITYTRSVTDTGERKQMFGFTARHVKTRTSMQPSPDACDKNPLLMETDGWYIDLDINFECLTNQVPSQRGMGGRPSGCQDRMVFRNTGAGRLGYALDETTRILEPDGKTVQSEITTKVLELSRETLDPSLFDVPAGYQQARSQQELFDPSAMMQAMQQSQGNDDDENAGASSSRPNRPNRPGGGGSGGMASVSSGGMNGSVGAKQPGTIRIGVARIGNKTTQSVDAGTMRATLIAAINESGVEAIPLNESAPDAAQAEAKQKSCDFVLFTDVSGLKQSTANKIGGFMGRATGVGSSADRFEAKVDYTLTPIAGGAPVQASATAKEDGGADASVNSALRKEAQAVAARAHK